jgi:coenzyme F420-0:L-glutamate ligase
VQLVPIKTRIIEPGDDLIAVLEETGFEFKDGDVLVVSSKVVSFAENRLASADKFEELVALESEKLVKGEVVDLSKKYGIWIANAGIDKSNVPAGQIVLWPADPQKSADELRDRFDFENFGVIITDSVCQPGRQGVTGACITYSGFVGVEDARGSEDLFGNKLQITTVAKADMVSAAANLLMGEADECVPFVVVRNAPVKFSSEKVDSIAEQSIAEQDCIFKPMFK